MYTKENFGYELEQKLEEKFNVAAIAKWAYEKYLLHNSDLNKELSRVIMGVVTMEEGPEFEYTREELLKIAKDLQHNHQRGKRCD